MAIHTTTIACMAKKRKDRHKKIAFNHRIPKELDERFRRRAEETRRTLTMELIIALEKHLAEPDPEALAGK